MSSSKAASNKQASRSLVLTFLWLLSGPLLWSIHFAVIYGAHAVLCARGFSQATAASVVGGATIAILLVLAGLLARSRASSGLAKEWRFERQVVQGLVVLSLVAVAWAGAASLLVPGCLSLR